MKLVTLALLFVLSLVSVNAKTYEVDCKQVNSIVSSINFNSESDDILKVTSCFEKTNIEFFGLIKSKKSEVRPRT